MRYRKGDEIILKIEDSFGYSDKTFRNVKVQIIGFNTDCDGSSAEYLVYVPSYEFIKNSWTLNQSAARKYDVDNKFIGDDVIFISARHPIIKHIPTPDGERCDKCKEFFEGAQRNESGCYTCCSCRLNPWR